MDWLSRQEPEISFETAKLRSESDWIAAGRLVFEAPVQFGLIETFRIATWQDSLHIPLTAEGTVPGRFRWTSRKQQDIHAARGLTSGLYFPSCNSSLLADGIMTKDLDEIARMYESIPPGVNTRIGSSILMPPEVADLIGIKTGSISI